MNTEHTEHTVLLNILRMLKIALNTGASDSVVRILLDKLEEYRNGVVEFTSDEKLLAELDEAEKGLQHMREHPLQETCGHDDVLSGKIEILLPEAVLRGLR